ETQSASKLFGSLHQECVNGTGFRQTNEPIFQCFFKIDTFLIGERMVFASHQNQTVASIWQELQTTVLWRGSGNADIGSTVEHRLHHLVAQALVQFYIDVCVRSQVARQNVWHEFVHGRRVGAYFHQPFDPTGKLLHFPAQMFKLPHHYTGVAQKGISRRGERDALTATKEDGCTQPLLKVLHPAAGCRKGKETPFGALRHTAGGGYIDHKLQVSEVKMHRHESFSFKTPKARFRKRELAALES